MKKSIFINISLLTFTLLSSCGEKDYAKNNLINPEDFFTRTEEKYGVYYFSENCPMCQESEPYIIEYLNKLQRDSSKELKNIYFIDASTTPIEKYVDSGDYSLFLETQIGITDYNDLLQVGYPLLYIVEKIEQTNTLIDIKIGRTALTNYIKEIW